VKDQPNVASRHGCDNSTAFFGNRPAADVLQNIAPPDAIGSEERDGKRATITTGGEWSRKRRRESELRTRVGHAGPPCG
jgi:hypothetical protein